MCVAVSRLRCVAVCDQVCVCVCVAVSRLRCVAVCDEVCVCVAVSRLRCVAVCSSRRCLPCIDRAVPLCRHLLASPRTSGLSLPRPGRLHVTAFVTPHLGSAVADVVLCPSLALSQRPWWSRGCSGAGERRGGRSQAPSIC